MNFFKLTYSIYDSDVLHTRKNPIKWANEYVVPGVICPECGTWSGHRRLFLPIDDRNLRKQLEYKRPPLPLDDWNQLARSIANLDPTHSYKPRPGDELGEPTCEISSSSVFDFTFPWTGGILVSEAAIRVIHDSKLTGCKFMKVRLIDKRKNKGLDQPLPLVYVLIVTGRIKTPTTIDRCYLCNRIRASYLVTVNDQSWDGNDFVIDENFPELVYVTEKACTEFLINDLQNYRCIPVSNL